MHDFFAGFVECKVVELRRRKIDEFVMFANQDSGRKENVYAESQSERIRYPSGVGFPWMRMVCLLRLKNRIIISSIGTLDLGQITVDTPPTWDRRGWTFA